MGKKKSKKKRLSGIKISVEVIKFILNSGLFIGMATLVFQMHQAKQQRQNEIEAQIEALNHNYKIESYKDMFNVLYEGASQNHVRMQHKPKLKPFG